MLEYDILREVLRGRRVHCSPQPPGQAAKGASELQPEA
jgi:hypothetical protein